MKKNKPLCGSNDTCVSKNVVLMDKTPTSLDRSNTSSTLQYSNFINRSRASRVYQGQPSALTIKKVGLTTAEIYFSFIGSPLSYQIILTNNISGTKYYSANHTEFVSIGYYKVSGLVPNNEYEVNVIAYYVSGDVFSVNFPKSFTTATAQGVVKSIRFENPTGETYTINSESKNKTSFDIIFTPLNDNPEYEVIVKDVSFIKFPHSQITVPDISFNTAYDVNINSLYGVNPDYYVYTASRTHSTLNEKHMSYLSIASVQNTSVDLSYTFVDISNIAYKLFIEHVCVKTDTSYNGVFHVSDLSINTSYGNTYVSVRYPSTENEYINRLSDISFITLNEGNAQIDSITIRNTEIGILFSNPYGDSKTLYVSLKNDADIQIGEEIAFTERNGSHTFRNLRINQSYVILIKSVYGGRSYSDCVQEVRTLNEGPVENIIRKNPDLFTTRFLFDLSYDFQTVSTLTYTLYDSSYTISRDRISLYDVEQTRAVIDVSFVDLYDLSVNTAYIIKFVSVYQTSNNSYTTPDINFVTIKDKTFYNENSFLSATRIKGDSLVLTLSEGTYYNSHDISFSNRYSNFRISTGGWTQENSSSVYFLSNLDKDTSYNFEVTSFFTAGDEGFLHNPIHVKTRNEGVANISNILVSDTNAKITWSYDADISMIRVPNQVVADFSCNIYGLSMNTTYEFNTETIYKTTNNSYISSVVFRTLNEKAPTYLINTYFGIEAGDTVTRIEAQNTFTDPSDIYSTTININGHGTMTTVLDVTMLDRFSNYSGNIVTLYNQKQPHGYYTYKTKPYITNFSFETIAYKPVYTVDSSSIHMAWYDISINPIRDISYSIHIFNNGVYDVSGDVYSFDISGLTLNTNYDISFIRRFSSGATKTEFERVRTSFQGNAS